MLFDDPTLRHRPKPRLENTVVGPYELGRSLGGGGFGTVYEALHRVTGRRVALKLLTAGLAETTRPLERFDREIRAIRALAHRNIVQLHDAGWLAANRPYLVTELVGGTDLGRRIRSNGPLDVDEVVEIVVQLCAGLSAAHARGVVHRDVKPANVMLEPVDQSVRVVLLDFGLAKLLDPDEPALTAKRYPLGTPSTMAPEQILGRHIDARTDVYSLGALTYTMLCGRYPYRCDDLARLFRMHLAAPIPAASRNARVPLAVDDVIRTAMAKRPDDRFATVEAFRVAFSTSVR